MYYLMFSFVYFSDWFLLMGLCHLRGRGLYTIYSSGRFAISGLCIAVVHARTHAHTHTHTHIYIYDFGDDI